MGGQKCIKILHMGIFLWDNFCFVFSHIINIFLLIFFYAIADGDITGFRKDSQGELKADETVKWRDNPSPPEIRPAPLRYKSKVWTHLRFYTFSGKAQFDMTKAVHN